MKYKYVFFRNDDVFEASSKFTKLLNIFVQHKIPLTLSVIPAKITDKCRDYLAPLVRKNKKTIEIAQHGLSHRDYSLEDKAKFEFGPRRSFLEQKNDIAKGKKIIKKTFGLDPVIFVPPWNVFDYNTFRALESEEFSFFSTDIKHPTSYRKGALSQIFTNIYFNQKDADNSWITNDENEVYRSIKSARDNIFGIEMHHEYFRDADFIRLNRLLVLLRKDPAIKFIPMADGPKYGRKEPAINPISLLYYLIYQFVPKSLKLFVYGDTPKTQNSFFYGFVPDPKIQKNNFNYFASHLYSNLKETTAKLLPKNNKPIGLLISGGIDSAALLHLIREVSDRKIYTITASYDQNSPHLHLVGSLAKQYATRHKNLIIGPEALLEMSALYSKTTGLPIGDNGLLPTYLMVRKLRENAHVIFTGEGADCLFLGLKLNAFVSKERNPDHKYYLSNEVFLNRHELLSYFLGSFGYIDADLPLKEVYDRISTPDVLKKQVLMNLNFLANNRIDYLTQIEKLCDIKIVLPYLDKKFTEFALQIPSEFLVKNSEQKFVLKGAFRGKLPLNIIYAQKTGLTPPFRLWYMQNREFVMRTILKTFSLGIPKEYLKYLLSIFPQCDDYVKGMKIWIVLNLAYWYEHNKPPA